MTLYSSPSNNSVVTLIFGLPGGASAKNLPANAGDKRCLESLSWEDSLEESMATHSSVHAWRILWTEEPGGLQSIASQRVKYN